MWSHAACATRASRTGGRSLRSALAFASLITVFAATSADGAVTSLLQTHGAIHASPGATNGAPGNTKDGGPLPVQLDEAGDEAFSSSTLAGTAGSLALSSHGCAGPAIGAPGDVGFGGANTVGNYFEDFRVRSTQVAGSPLLPDGTPVSIKVKLAVSRAFLATVIQPYSIRAGVATVHGDASVSFNNGVAPVSFSGEFGRQQVYDETSTPSSTGIFAVKVPTPPEDNGEADADSFTGVLSGTIGGFFSINISSELGANSTAVNPIVTDADGQLSLVWGADVLVGGVGGLAELRDPNDNAAFPPMSNATEDNALAHLPPRPDDDTPEPASLAALCLGTLGLVRRRAPL